MKPSAGGLFFAVFAVLTAALPSIAAEPIKIGVVRSNGGIPAIIAKEKGYFAAEGVDAQLIFFDSAQPISVAVASGDCDFARPGSPRPSTTSRPKGRSRSSPPALGTGAASKASE